MPGTVSIGGGSGVLTSSAGFWLHANKERASMTAGREPYGLSKVISGCVFRVKKPFPAGFIKQFNTGGNRQINSGICWMLFRLFYIFLLQPHRIPFGSIPPAPTGNSITFLNRFRHPYGRKKEAPQNSCRGRRPRYS